MHQVRERAFLVVRRDAASPFRMADVFIVGDGD